jgi:hypothetical protein
MLKFTCGSSLPLDYSKFDGVVAGYHLSLWGQPSVFDIPDKIYRGQFLYGHRHQKPDPSSGCETIAEWVTRRVSLYPVISEWVLINEFTDDLGVPYPNYKIDNLKRYFEAAHLANPEAKLIVGEFKPHLLKKWESVSNICLELKASGFPVEMGVQTHMKTYNAPVILTRLPKIIEMFDVPVHFIEASLWYKSVADKAICNGLWSELISIAEQHQVQSFCNWWLMVEDIEVGRRMPTFESLKLYIKE